MYRRRQFIGKEGELVEKVRAGLPSQGQDTIENHPAVPTDDGLHPQIGPLGSPSGGHGAVATFRTFKQIGLTHGTEQYFRVLK